jgi:Ca2+:H+ antiporter
VHARTRRQFQVYYLVQYRTPLAVPVLGATMNATLRRKLLGSRTAWPQLAREWPLVICSGAAVVMIAGKSAVAAMIGSPAVMVAMLAGVSGVMLLGALAIVRHAETLAHRLGEPRGTLLLTMAITGLEAAMVGLVMSTGAEKPALPRDTMYAVVMLVLNGFLGLSLLMGGIRHTEQPYNPQSANAFLVMLIPFTVLSLVLPNFTRATPGPTLSSFQMAFLSLASIAIYAIFLMAQTTWHRGFFVFGMDAEVKPTSEHVDGDADGGLTRPGAGPRAAPGGHSGESAAPTLYHVLLLLLYCVCVVLLAKMLSTPLDSVVLTLGAPSALAGFLIALLVLTPESIAATKAARRNELQRAINILLGSALASIGLTVPIVISVAILTGRRLVLGLQPAESVLLALTLVVSMLTFNRPRTNLLMGSVHLLLFAVALLLVFDT